MAVVTNSIRFVKAGQGSKQDSHKLIMKVRCDSPLDNTWTVYAHDLTPKRGAAAPASYGLPTGTKCLGSTVEPMGESPW